MPSAHAKLSPSGAYHWLYCPGSAHAEPASPDMGSEASDVGTACHGVAQRCLEELLEPEVFIGQTLQFEEKQRPVVFTEEMAAHVRECVEWVREYLAGHPGAILYTETQIDIGLVFGLPVLEDGKTALWGTADFVIVTSTELVVGDFKFGFRHVPVTTPQLYLYLLGFLHQLAAFSFTSTRRVIIQPRAEGVQELEAPINDVLDFGRGIKAAVLAALDPDAPRIPGKAQCQFCKHAPICRELHAETMKVAAEEFAEPEGLTLEQVAEVLEKADMIRGHLKAVEGFAARMLSAGNPIPGYKLVRRRCNRAWGDVAQAQATLETFGIGPDKYLSTPEMCSPAQAEKLLGKKGKAVLAPLIVQPVGAPTIAPESDPRPAVTGDFDEWKDEEAA